jgi:hypothetical protein
MQSMRITTNVMSSYFAHGEVYSMQHHVIKFVNDLRQAGGFKSDCHDIAEILVKMALTQ